MARYLLPYVLGLWRAATSPQSVLWAGTGVISGAIGAFDISFPSGTMASWPRRCGWLVQLNYDTTGVEVLMSGRLHLRNIGAAFSSRRSC